MQIIHLHKKNALTDIDIRPNKEDIALKQW